MLLSQSGQGAVAVLSVLWLSSGSCWPTSPRYNTGSQRNLPPVYCKQGKSAAPRNSAAFTKIPRRGVLFRGPRKTVGLTDQWLMSVGASVSTLKGKQLELSTPNLVHTWQLLGMHWPRGQMVKGQGQKTADHQGRTAASGCYGHCATAADAGLHLMWLLTFRISIRTSITALELWPDFCASQLVFVLFLLIFCRHVKHSFWKMASKLVCTCVIIWHNVWVAGNKSKFTKTVVLQEVSWTLSLQQLLTDSAKILSTTQHKNTSYQRHSSQTISWLRTEN